MMLGYYKMPEATLRESRNLWFHTGDRGYLDADGYLYFVDRKKEAIRRRGENIFPAYEVEILIAKHPQVLEVAAVAVSSELSEDEVMAYIVAKPGARPRHEEIIEFCSDDVLISWCPASSSSSMRCRRRQPRRSRSTSSRPRPKSGASTSGIARSPESR